MVDGGFYKKVPVLDVVLDYYVMSLIADRVLARERTIVAVADSFEVGLF